VPGIKKKGRGKKGRLTKRSERQGDGLEGKEGRTEGESSFSKKKKRKGGGRGGRGDEIESRRTGCGGKEKREKGKKLSSLLFRDGRGKRGGGERPHRVANQKRGGGEMENRPEKSATLTKKKEIKML